MSSPHLPCHLVIYLGINTAFYLHCPPTAALCGSIIASASCLTLKSIRLQHQTTSATHSPKSYLFLNSPHRTCRRKLEQPWIDTPRMENMRTRQPPDPRPHPKVLGANGTALHRLLPAQLELCRGEMFQPRKASLWFLPRRWKRQPREFRHERSLPRLGHGERGNGAGRHCEILCAGVGPRVGVMFARLQVMLDIERSGELLVVTDDRHGLEFGGLGQLGWACQFADGMEPVAWDGGEEGRSTCEADADEEDGRDGNDENDAEGCCWTRWTSARGALGCW